MKTHVGYCTNVHAGVTLGQAREKLERYARAVKRQVCPNRPMGIGLWLPAPAAREILQGPRLQEWKDWLAEVGLTPFTVNGFPYGDFHQPVVKHRVYEPNWASPERLEYTLDLIAIQDGLLPPGLEGSISTLPLFWGRPEPSEAQLKQAAVQLRTVADRLARLERERGRLLYLCLEPEPGCALQRSGDVVRFFEHYLLPGSDEKAVRRHIRICHDVCHAVVMFEEQAEVLSRYRAAGIGVGKVQISSALVMALQQLSATDQAAALRQLGRFAEDRYLHQTMVARPGRPSVFYDDLPEALNSERTGEWRVHYHIPVYLERFGLLAGSQRQIVECVREVTAHEQSNHFEVETYAWGVLPAELQQPDLAAGIAEEMRWFQGVLDETLTASG